MIKAKKISDVLGMHVYTDKGDYYGDVEESILQNNKVSSWKIKATKYSRLSQLLSGAKGVTVPHKLVKSIGDIMLISNAALPSGEDVDSCDDFGNGWEERACPYNQVARAGHVS